MPQQDPQPAVPAYPPQYQQSVPVQKEQKPKKRLSALTALIIVLAVVIAVEGVIAGVWYPGFFNPQKGGGPDINDTAIEMINKLREELYFGEDAPLIP